MEINYKINDGRVDLKSLNADELTSYIESLGEKKFRANQIYQWMHEKLVTDFDSMKNVPSKLLDTLKENAHLTALTPIRHLKLMALRNSYLSYMMGMSLKVCL